MSADFAASKRRALDDDGGLAFIDDFQNVRGRQWTGALDVPSVTAIGLNSGGGNVKNQFARITQIRIGIDGLAGGLSNQIGDRKIQNRLRAVRAHP